MKRLFWFRMWLVFALVKLAQRVAPKNVIVTRNGQMTPEQAAMVEKTLDRPAQH